MTAFDFPSLPLEPSGVVLAVLMAVVLIVPVVFERARIPGIIGLVAAGVVLGPGGFGVLGRSGAVRVLGELGLLYLLFLLGLRLALDTFDRWKRESLVIGVTSFAVPLLVGLGTVGALGYSAAATVLLASSLASQTLITLPLFRRLGLGGERAVVATIGGTIVANTAALLLLAVVVRAAPGGGDSLTWAVLALQLAGLCLAALYGLPLLARWFFAGIGLDRTVRFLFVLTALFVVSGVSEFIGIPAPVGAFLAGLGLNRSIPHGGVLMQRVEFFGSTFLVPIFLVYAGMLVDPAVLLEPSTLLLAAALLAAAVLGKAVGAVVAGVVLELERSEIITIYGLTVAQAAGTLAAVIVGLDADVITLDAVHGVMPVILVSCLVSRLVSNRASGLLPRPAARPRDIGEAVLVPVVNPESARGLVRLAGLIARPDSGIVMPLTVVGPETSDEQLEERRTLMARAESIALSVGVDASGLVRIDGSPAAGVLHTIVEHRASFMVVGWKGHTGAREHLFGSMIDSIVGRSPIPLAVIRLVDNPVRRLLLCVYTGNLSLSRRPGVQLAADIARRLHAGMQMPLAVLTDTDESALAELLEGLDVEVYTDPRRQHVAVADHATPDDLVVVSVSPTETGLRTAATRIAWAAPSSSILVALDAGTRRGTEPADQPLETWDMWTQA